MIFLRQSTASQEVPLGRFVDSTDGNTEETALTIANTDIKIWKTGATTLASKNSGGATHIANGEYYAVFDATDTDTIGPMKITIHVAGALYVQVWATVLDEAVYDALFGTTALATATNITAATGIVLSGVTHTGAVIPTVTTLTGHTAQTGDVYALANGANGFANIKSDTAAILVDTGTTLDARIPAALVGGRMDANVGAISSDATAADNAEAFFDGTGYAGTGNTIPTVTTVGTVTTVTGLTASNLDTTVSSRLATSGYTAPPSAASNATAVLTTAMTESYGTDGGTVTLAQGIYELLAFLQERSAAGTTLTVKKRDGSTTAYTLTLGNATDPTSITRAT